MGVQNSTLPKAKKPLDYYMKKGLISINVCDLTKYFVNLDPKEQSSASNSQIIFGDLILRNNKTGGRESFPIVIKAFIPSSDNSLTVEAKIYTNFIRRIIMDKICPCFINVIAFKKCPGLLLDVRHLPSTTKQKQVLEKGMKNIRERIEAREGIKITSFDDLEVNVLVLERAVNSETLHQYVREKKHPEPEVKIILLELMYALVCMQEYKVVHNDIHDRNIFITDTGKEETYLFALGTSLDQLFLFNSRKIPKIFDWDRGSAEGYVNKILEVGQLCIQVGECNIINNKRDLYFIICSLSSTYLGKLPWFIEFMNRIISPNLVEMQKKISSVKVDVPCRLRSPEKNKGAFIPPDPLGPLDPPYPGSELWMKSSKDVLLTDPLFKPYNCEEKNGVTMDNFLYVKHRNIYGLTTEIRRQVIETIENYRKTKSQANYDMMDITA